MKSLRNPVLQFCALMMALVFPAALFGQEASATVQSPDQRLRLQFAVVSRGESAGGTGQLVYSLSVNGKPLLVNSGLSLNLAGGRRWAGRCAW